MSVARTHRAVGAVFGVCVALAIAYLVNTGMAPAEIVRGGQIDLFYLLLAGFCGLIGGLLPDILEPSYTRGPSHRSILHGFPFLGGLIVVAVLMIYGKILPSPEQFYLRNIIFFIIVGYISHLVLDRLSSLFRR